MAKTTKIHVAYIDGSEETFATREEAAKDIADKYAEGGENPVQEAWEETRESGQPADEEGDIKSLAVEWTVELVEN